MAKRILIVLVILALACGLAGWKWAAPKHRIAGWTWDAAAQPTWTDD